MPNRRTLLVEGTDDEHVIRHICLSRGIPEPDRIAPHGSVEELLKSIPANLKLAGDGDVIGVVADADANLDVRWDAIRNRLLNAGFANAPAQPDPSGMVLDAPDETLLAKVGIWVMPDNSSPGNLEHFLLPMIPQGDDLFDHAAECVESIANPRFRQQDKTKALIHTWLAWQARPGRPYGTAITARFLDAGVPQVDAFAAWLRGMFG